jgi:hypothetical protein
MNKLLIAAKEIYYRVPTFIRFVFWPAAQIYGLACLFRGDQWIIRGEEVSSKQTLAILFTGNELNKNYLAELAFGSSHVDKHLGSRWLWQVSLKVKNGNFDCSLVITELPEAFRMLFRKKNCFYVPCWISGEIDIPADILSIIKKEDTLQSYLRRIRKHGLQFDITNDMSQFHKFYYDMYLPYANARFGNSAFLAEYDYLKKHFQRCDLLLVKKDGEYIAGDLVLNDKESAKLMINGVKDGNLEHLKHGAIAATYHFMIEYLRGRGYKKVNLGGTRAFLKDGVLHYKRKWGLRINGTMMGKGFLISPKLQTAGLQGFLINNPFVFIDKEGFKGAIFIGADQSLVAERLEKAYRDYYLEGLIKLSIYRFTKDNRGIKEIILT